MSRFLTFLTLVSISFSVRAELVLFKNQDAIQKVLTSPEIVSRLATARSETRSASVSAVSYGNALNKKFIVRIATKTDTAAGTRVCYNDINVDSEINAEKKADGTLQTISRLVIKKINPGVCGKPSAVASRI